MDTETTKSFTITHTQRKATIRIFVIFHEIYCYFFRFLMFCIYINYNSKSLSFSYHILQNREKNVI